MIQKLWNREKSVETEVALYRYGSAYHTGLSARVCAQQTPSVFKIKRKHHCGECIRYCSSHSWQMTD